MLQHMGIVVTAYGFMLQHMGIVVTSYGFMVQHMGIVRTMVLLPNTVGAVTGY